MGLSQIGYGGGYAASQVEVIMNSGFAMSGQFQSRYNEAMQNFLTASRNDDTVRMSHFDGLARTLQGNRDSVTQAINTFAQSGPQLVLMVVRA